MKTIIFALDSEGEVKALFPKLRAFQVFEFAEAEAFIEEENRKFSDGYHFKKVIRIDKVQDFFNFHDKKAYCDKVISELEEYDLYVWEYYKHESGERIRVCEETFWSFISSKGNDVIRVDEIETETLFVVKEADGNYYPVGSIYKRKGF